MRHWGNLTKTIPWLTLFTSHRPCCAHVPVLTLYTQSLFGTCVCVRVSVFACMYSIAKCICVVQRAFKGLCVHTWECAGVQRFVSLCLCIYMSCLPWIIVHYPPAFQILGNKRFLSGLALCRLWVVPLWVVPPCGPGIWVAPTQQHFIKQRWIRLLPIWLSTLSISLAFF